MKVKHIISLALAFTLVGCASTSRRIEPDKVSVFALEAPPASVRIVLVPVRDMTLMTAWRESAAGWNTPLFDERFGKRLVANFEANGMRATYRGASGLDAGQAGAAPDHVMLITMTRFSFATRNGMQDTDANYNIRVQMFKRGSTEPVLAYDDVMVRGFVGTHDNIPDRFTYSFFNLLQDRGKWPAGKKVAVGS